MRMRRTPLLLLPTDAEYSHHSGGGGSRKRCLAAWDPTPWEIFEFMKSSLLQIDIKCSGYEYRHLEWENKPLEGEYHRGCVCGVLWFVLGLVVRVVGSMTFTTVILFISMTFSV